MIILRILVFIYGLLTFLAVGEQAFAEGIQFAHVFYTIFSAILIFAAIKPEYKWILYIGMIGLLIFVIIYGYMTSTLQWSHILVRTIISLIVLLLWRVE